MERGVRWCVEDRSPLVLVGLDVVGEFRYAPGSRDFY
jgi:hypothetical protein